MPRILILDDLVDVRRLLKDRLQVDLPNMEIDGSTREEVVDSLNSHEMLPSPDVVITDLYSFSDDLVVLFDGLNPTVTQNVSDESLQAELRLLERITKAWPTSKIIVFSHFQDSLHLTAKQVQLTRKRLRVLGVTEPAIIQKKPLDAGLRKVVELVASTLGIPHINPCRDSIVFVV